MKLFIASFNRASDGAINLLVKKLIMDNMYTEDYKEADYILAVGDRKETYDFVLEMFRENISIIHLWAGEISQGTHDEVYRHSMTLMSDIQLCTHENAKRRVELLCESIDKIPCAYVIGNLFIDDLTIDESKIPDGKYDLVLYNPSTLGTVEDVKKEIQEILKELEKSTHIWMEPNGDKYSELVSTFVTTKTVSRPQFLGLLKNCNKFISNSSSLYYEAPLFLKDEQIIHIGERNKNRECMNSDLTIGNASDNIIKVLKEYENNKR